MSEESTITLDQEAIETIRHALILSLGAYGEVVRVQSEVKFWKDMGKETPEGVMPLSPDGPGDAIGDFANALAYLR